MKTLGAFIGLSFVGLICGVSVATLDIAFEPKHCGEDCANIAWSSMLTWAPICTAGFAAIGLPLWIRGERTGKGFVVVCLALALLTLAPAGGVYLYRASHQTAK